MLKYSKYYLCRIHSNKLKLTRQRLRLKLSTPTAIKKKNEPSKLDIKDLHNLQI